MSEVIYVAEVMAGGAELLLLITIVLMVAGPLSNWFKLRFCGRLGGPLAVVPLS